VSDRVQAVVDECGPTDFGPHLDLLTSRKLIDDPNLPTSIYYQYFGGPVRTRKRLMRQASPLRYVSPDDAPFLIIHGELDNVVPLENSQWLDAALRQANVPSQLIVQPGIKHDVRKALSLEQIRAFLIGVLKKEY
jgi:dipeptidyl aminopeptidase/acylaminoacyl peptidase